MHSTEDLLAEINERFAECYQAGETEKRRQLGQTLPVLAIIEDRLHFLDQGEHQACTLNTSELNHLRALSNLPLILYFLSRDVSTDSHPGARVGLAELSQQLEGMVASMRQPKDARVHDLDKGAVEKYLKVILSMGEELQRGEEYAKVFAHHQPNLARFAMAAERCLSLTLLRLLREQLTLWLRDYPADIWEKLHIVVSGDCSRRAQSAFKRYFQPLLATADGSSGAPLNEERLFFIGDADHLDDVLDDLATCLVDQELSAIFPEEQSASGLSDVTVDQQSTTGPQTTRLAGAKAGNGKPYVPGRRLSA